MVNRIGAQVGLLAFALAIAAGLLVGNPTATVLSRALLALVGGFLAGQAGAWLAKIVLREHLQQRKRRIDDEHVELARSAAETPSDAP
jgi:fructose-specific phosphotransferase system IIC component